MAFQRESFERATNWSQHKDAVLVINPSSAPSIDSAYVGLGVVVALGAAYLFKKFKRWKMWDRCLQSFFFKQGHWSIFKWNVIRLPTTYQPMLQKATNRFYFCESARFIFERSHSFCSMSWNSCFIQALKFLTLSVDNFQALPKKFQVVLE